MTQAGIPFGTPFTIPPNRDRLRQGFNVGNQHFSEGMLVVIRAFVLDSRHSNVRKGENVNCNIHGRKANDIHIELGSTPGSDPCNGVTAEISPHFGPDVWDEFDDYIYTHPVMFFGQLFYDASHKPCTPGHRVNPARISSWEIHPIYSIFVCKNASPFRFLLNFIPIVIFPVIETDPFQLSPQEEKVLQLFRCKIDIDFCKYPHYV